MAAPSGAAILSAHRQVQVGAIAAGYWPRQL